MRLCLPLIILAGCSSGAVPANTINANMTASNVASGNAAQPDSAKAQPAALPALDRAAFHAGCLRDYRSTPNTDPAQAEEVCREEWPAAEAGAPLSDAVAALARAPGASPPTLAEAQAAFATVRWQPPTRDTRAWIPDALAQGRVGELEIYLRGARGAVTAIFFHSFAPDNREMPVIADWEAALRGRGATRTVIGCPDYAQGSYGAYGPPEAMVSRLEIPGRPAIAYLESSSYQGPGHELVGASSSLDLDLTGAVPTLATLRSGRWPIAERAGDVAGWSACQ